MHTGMTQIMSTSYSRAWSTFPIRRKIGTIYSKSELQELYATCKELGLPLFMDGARMGYGLMSENQT